MHRISSSSSLEDVIEALESSGCPDLTSFIDLATCGNLPLAGGGFCDVYQGGLHRGTKIAIKSLRLFERPGSEDIHQKVLKRAARELYYWSKMKHCNVLPLMGLAIFRGNMSMISEWMDNGSLTAYIENNPKIDRKSLCMDVCAGLSYIHTNGMVHGDLKAANVMVSCDGVAMIADFGNSQLKDLTLQFSTTKNASISVRWAAPELLTNDNSPVSSREADVYAYGMTVLETITGQVPYCQYSERRVVVLVGVKHQVPDRPTVAISDGLWRMLLQCWAAEPSDRIDIQSIEERLREIFGGDPTEVTEAGGLPLADDKKTFSGTPTTGFQSPVMLDGPAEKEGARRVHSKGVVESEKAKVDPEATHKRRNEEANPDVLRGVATLAAGHQKRRRIQDKGPQSEKVSATRQVALEGDSLLGLRGSESTYRQLGQFEQAAEVLVARKRVIGDGDPDALKSTANRAWTYREQGRLAAVESLKAGVSTAHKRLLGNEYPDSLRSAGNREWRRSEQGRLAEAESLEVDALATCKWVLGDDHPHTLASMGDLAWTYREQGRLADAESLDVEILAAHKRLLGDDHPDTLWSMGDLASTYSEQGRLVEAESLEFEVLAARKRVLGDDHPDTLTSMGNLASTYHQQGRLAEAESLGVEVLAARKRVIGDNHPHTIISRRNLALIYRDQGRQNQYDALTSEARAMTANGDLESQ